MEAVADMPKPQVTEREQGKEKVAEGKRSITQQEGFHARKMLEDIHQKVRIGSAGGNYDSNPKKAEIELIANYDQNNSEGPNAQSDFMRAIHTFASDDDGMLAEARRSWQITLPSEVDGQAAEILSFKDWESRLNPDPPLTDDERKALMDRAKYALKEFPPEFDELSDQALMGKKVADLDKSITDEKDPAKQEELQQLRGNLVAGREANGKLGILLRINALQTLEGMKVPTSEGRVIEAQAEASVAFNKLLEDLQVGGRVSREQAVKLAEIAASKGPGEALQKMIDNKIFRHVEDVGMLFFGKELDAETAEKCMQGLLLPSELKKNGEMSMFALLTIVMMSTLKQTANEIQKDALK